MPPAVADRAKAGGAQSAICDQRHPRGREDRTENRSANDASVRTDLSGVCLHVDVKPPLSLFVVKEHARDLGRTSRPVSRVLSRTGVRGRSSLYDCRCRQPPAAYPQTRAGRPRTSAQDRVAPFPLGLAPSGVCLATGVTPGAGGLLHHRFTLTGPRGPAVCFLWHCPAGHPGWALPTTAPYGARTFLGDAVPAVCGPLRRRDRPADSSAVLQGYRALRAGDYQRRTSATPGSRPRSGRSGSANRATAASEGLPPPAHPAPTAPAT